MNFSKHLILASTALCFAMGNYSHVQAQSSNPEINKLKDALTFAEQDCWSGGYSGDDYKRETYEAAYQAFDDELRNNRYPESLENEARKKHPFLLNCPPKRVITDDGGRSLMTPTSVFFGDNAKTERTQESQPKSQNSGIRLSGYGRFGLDYNRNSPYNSTSQASNDTQFIFSSGVTRIKPPQVGYGVAIIPGSERFVARTDETLDGYNLGVFVRAKDGKYMFGVEYTDVDGSSEGQIANGTDNTGLVYHDFAPSGSTGVNIGPRGLDVRTDSLTTRLRLQFDMSTETDGGVSFGSRFRLGAGAEFTDTEHRANVTTPSFNDISSTSTQKIDENNYFLSGATTLSFGSLTEKNTLRFSLTPKIEAGYRDANLNSSQTNICGLCGATDQNFITNIDDDDNGFYYDGSLEAQFSYRVSDKFTVGLTGAVGYRSHVAEIINPEIGDDLFLDNSPSHLETDSEYRDSINVWFSAEF